jgi:hypothetical protein
VTLAGRQQAARQAAVQRGGTGARAGIRKRFLMRTPRQVAGPQQPRGREPRRRQAERNGSPARRDRAVRQAARSEVARDANGSNSVALTGRRRRHTGTACSSGGAGSDGGGAIRSLSQLEADYAQLVQEVTGCFVSFCPAQRDGMPAKRLRRGALVAATPGDEDVQQRSPRGRRRHAVVIAT